MESLRLGIISACRMTSRHFWNSSCQTQTTTLETELNQPFRLLLFVLLDDEKKLDEGRHQPKNVVLMFHQNHLIFSVVSDKYGFEQTVSTWKNQKTQMDSTSCRTGSPTSASGKPVTL